MSRSWAEKFAVVAMVLGLVALVAVSVAALLTAAGVFICLVALLYIINPAGMRAALKVLADKVDAWLAKAHEWLDGLKEILSAFQSAAGHPGNHHNPSGACHRSGASFPGHHR